MSRAGVVAALAAEARTLGPRRRRPDGLFTTKNGTLVAVCGMGGSAATAAAHRLIDAGASGLVSWGMAGGLDPHLQAGTICLPRVVAARDGASCVTDSRWREILIAVIARRRVVVGGQLLTSAAAIHDVAGKAAAFRDTGAVAVDMESLCVGEVAALHGVPFVAVRVIVDTARDAVPDFIMAASVDGQIDVPRLIWSLLRAPRDLKALLRLARRYRDAIRALTVVARTGALCLFADPASRTRVA